MKIKHTFICLLTLLSGLIYAQESLSLSDAIRMSLERNYDIRIEQKNVIVTDNNNNWGEAGMMPTVNFNATSNNSVYADNNGDQFFNGQTFPGFELKNQRTYALTPSVNANWIMFNGFRVKYNKARLENLLQLLSL